MGTASTKKFLKQSNGALAEEAALTTSAGAGDAHKIPALNASGVLDISIINGKAVSAGAADAGKPIVANGSGKLDETMLPTGIGADVASIVTSEALIAGDYINVWSDGGVFKVRKADATVEGKHAMGFVKSAVASGAAATVYFEGTNDQVTGQVPGDVFLQITAGRGAATVPSASGNVVQRLGFAVSATAVNFHAGVRTVLA
jgi:hypothetical protein